MPRLRIFLTWSGERSKTIAHVLKTWLPCVIQGVEPWMSESDVEKGSRWRSEISAQLQQAKIGIICLTPENLQEPWIHFEAGAISKVVNESRVCTFLYDLSPASVKEPLGQFQATKADKEDTRKLVHTINAALEAEHLDLAHLNAIFEKWWPDLERELAKIPKASQKQQKASRPVEDSLEEVVSLVREQSRITDELRVKLDEISKRSAISAVSQALMNRSIYGFKDTPASLLASPESFPSYKDYVEVLEAALEKQKLKTDLENRNAKAQLEAIEMLKEELRKSDKENDG